MDYGKMKPTEFINLLLGDTERCPCLMIGEGYVNTFKRIYKGRIITVYTLQDVRNLIEMCTGVRDVTGGYMVLDGVGKLSDVGQSSLLKFIEEMRVPIILLSYNDRVSPVIMSRMKIVVKSFGEVKSLDFAKTKDAVKYIKDKKENNKNFDEFDEVVYFSESCPGAFSLKSSCGDPFDKSYSRVLEVIVGIGEGK